jgi:glyoxylase-like metal-dependent hydrolase (beta-lactamase superfamily II)
MVIVNITRVETQLSGRTQVQSYWHNSGANGVGMLARTSTASALIGNGLGWRLAETRRQFLNLGLGAAAAYCLTPEGVSAATRPSLAMQPLRGRLSLVQGGAGNILLAQAESSLLLVDGGAGATAKPLQSLLKKHAPGAKLTAVFNTHWHVEQSGFNATARAQGADVLAHENTKLWLGTEVHSKLDGVVHRPQSGQALPNKTFFYGAQEFALGGSKVQYGHLGQAHTDGDIYVRFAEENVIAVGDVLSAKGYPLIDASSNGWLGGIHSALKTLAALCDSETLLMPGQGGPLNLEALKRQQELCFNVLTRIGESYYKGQTFQELLASKPAREVEAQLGDPTRFLQTAYETAWYHVGEIRRVAR